MSTVHVDHVLSDFIEGTMARPQFEKTKSHLVFCNACRQVQRELEKNRETLSHLPAVAVPADLEQRILNGFKESPAPVIQEAPPKPSRPLPTKQLFQAGAVIGGVFLLFFIVKSLPKHAAPQTAVAPPTETAPDVQVPAVVETPKEVVPVPPPVQAAPIVEEKPVKPVAPSVEKVAPPVEPAAPQTDGQINLRGDSSGIDDARELVIKNERGWKNLWKNHVKNTVPPPPMPAVNFETYDVIAVFLGSRSTGGYSVQIGDIEETSWEGSPARIVHLKTIEPAPGMMNTMALTQPFHIMTAPKHAGRTFFRKNR
jgi:hypothetical protein